MQGMKEAVLQLSSVNLPGGEQRMRSYEDQLQMRAFFNEGDLVSAEVQAMQADGAAGLHTRSMKYGKLENGQLYVVPACLVKRLKQHSVTLECGVDLILGNNGFVWIARARTEALGAEAEAEDLESDRLAHASTAVLPDERLRICRVRNSIAALCSVSALISPDAIMAIYRRSESLGLHPKALLEQQAVAELLQVGDERSAEEAAAEEGNMSD